MDSVITNPSLEPYDVRTAQVGDVITVTVDQAWRQMMRVTEVNGDELTAVEYRPELSPIMLPHNELLDQMPVNTVRYPMVPVLQPWQQQLLSELLQDYELPDNPLDLTSRSAAPPNDPDDSLGDVRTALQTFLNGYTR